MVPALTQAWATEELLWAGPGAGPELATAGRRGSRGREKVGAAGAGEGWEEPVDRGANPGRRGDAGREGGTCGRVRERHRRGRRGRRALRSEPGAARRRQPGHRPRSVPAQATRPPGRGADGPTDGAACRRRPAMFSRSSRKRLSSRSVSVPHLSGADLRVPPGLLQRPCPASLRPAAAHLWPQVSRPQARGRVRGARERSKARKGLSPDPPVWASARPGAVALCVTV